MKTSLQRPFRGVSQATTPADAPELDASDEPSPIERSLAGRARRFFERFSLQDPEVRRSLAGAALAAPAVLVGSNYAHAMDERRLDPDTAYVEILADPFVEIGGEPVRPRDAVTGEPRAPAPSDVDLERVGDSRLAADLSALVAVRPDLLDASVRRLDDGSHLVSLKGDLVIVSGAAAADDPRWATVVALALESQAIRDPEGAPEPPQYLSAFLDGGTFEIALPEEGDRFESFRQVATALLDGRPSTFTPADERALRDESGRLISAQPRYGVLGAEILETEGKDRLRVLLHDPEAPRTPRFVDFEQLAGTFTVAGQAPDSRAADFDSIRREPPPAPPLEPGDVIYQVDDKEVRFNQDPGNYYCEHLFFIGQRMANLPDSSVVTNAHGERLVGFLHVPKDSFSREAPVAGEEPPYTQESRHAANREVLGRIMGGFLESAERQVDPNTPLRLLLTGYGPWSTTKNNPTGDFVRHQENIDAAMAEAFGEALLEERGQIIASDPDSLELAYSVVTPDGNEREILVRTQVLPVDDAALDWRSSSSIQSVMNRFEPHAVISTGATGASYYKAEYHADDRSLVYGVTPEHRFAPATTNLPDNYALVRTLTDALG